MAMRAMLLVLMGCSKPGEGVDPGQCIDGADNDEDGYFDCDDNDCWGAPDCKSGTNTGTNTDTDTETDTKTDPTKTDPTKTDPTDTGTPTTDTPCVGPLCELTRMELAFYVVIDPAFGPTCAVAMVGSGAAYSVDESWVVFQGDWAFDDGYTTCDAATKAAFHTWAGGAYHSFYLSSDSAFVYDWYAHRDLGDAVDDPGNDTVFFVTNMDSPIDMTLAEPTMLWHELFDYGLYGTFDQRLAVTFYKD